MTRLGSSETTREASVFNFQPFYTNCSNPTPPIPGFLEWFIGFTEGDGSFGLQKVPTLSNPMNTRPVFVINQQEPQVLFAIKKSLGFGIVKEIAARKGVNKHYRYTVGRIEHITQLMHLFSGNLVLKKTHRRFENWVESYNRLCDQRADLHHLNFYKPFHPPEAFPLERLDLDLAWFAGFTDAEGCFYVSLSQKEKRLRFKFQIKQKGEQDVLERIATLVQRNSSRNHVYRVKGKIDTYQFELTSKGDILSLVNYFDNYPLQSRTKCLVYARWKRLLWQRPIGEGKALKRFEKLVASVGKIRP